jgi:hypothetical protein
MAPKTHISSMVCTYKLYLLNRHLFIDLPEGRALIDTGAPFSSSVTGRLTWQNQNHGVNRGGYMGFTFDKLSAEIGAQVDALLGMDLLAQTTLLFDVANRQLTAGDDIPEGFKALPYSLVPTSDIPMLAITLNGRKALALWDTGAQYGYFVDNHFCEGLEPLPGFKDFSPMFGSLEITKSYHIPFTLHGMDLVEQCGPTPSQTCGGLSPVPMRTFLSLLNIDAIIGPSWMQRVKIWLNPIERTIALSA